MHKAKLGFRHVGIITIILLLASCAAMQVAYNNADLMIRLKVHEHFNLQGAQQTDFRARLTKFDKWHRAQELPLYEKNFRLAAERVSRGVKEEDVKWGINLVRERYKVLVRHAAEEATPVLITLTPDQITHLENQFAENNKKFAKENLSGSEAKQLAKRTKWVKKEFEKWLGPLSDQQEAMISAKVKESPLLANHRLANRKQNQQQFVVLLRKHKDAASLQPALQDFLENVESRRAPAFNQAVQQTEIKMTELILQIDKTLTQKQRQFASSRFINLANDFHKLSMN